ncbi:hypothetical protein CEXT_50301, partial [Caerostris extrusa]
MVLVRVFHVYLPLEYSCAYHGSRSGGFAIDLPQEMDPDVISRFNSDEQTIDYQEIIVPTE